MVPRSARLTRRAFEHAFRRGRRTKTTLFDLIYTPTPKDRYQVGVVVPKKVAKTAVVRNLLRRQLYHAFVEMLKHKNYTGSFILIMRPEVRTTPKEMLYTTLKEALDTPFGQ